MALKENHCLASRIPVCCFNIDRPVLKQQLQGVYSGDFLPLHLKNFAALEEISTSGP